MFDGCFDISHNNGVIRWSQVLAVYRLVFIKATQGHGFVDPLFITNRENCGRLVVPYHFIDLSPIEAQFANFAQITGLAHGSPCMLDWEQVPPTMQRATISNVEAFISLVRRATNRAPLMYHGMYDLSSKTINACPWNVPKYGPQPRGVPWLFWQNTPKAKIAGVPGDVDHDFFNGTEAELEAWFRDGSLPKGLAHA